MEMSLNLNLGSLFALVETAKDSTLSKDIVEEIVKRKKYHI